jgi:type I restriction enzyme S subunit
LRAYDLSKVFYSMGGGLRQSMKFSDLRRLPTILPSDDEQRAIGDFLDRETTKIDTLIAEQERLIALLAEKRQATILHVVRRGFDATVTTKDSGLSWIGEVPSHWRICSVGYLCSIATGATPEREEPRYWNGSIPWLKTGEINWAPVAAAEEFITTAALEETSVKVAMPGALLMAMYGQGATRGRVALLQIEAAFNQACAALSFDSRMSPEYARYFFMAAYDYVRDVGNETSQMNLSAGLISKMKVTVPPLTEQLAIVKLLDRESSKLEKLIAKAEGAVTLLKERRSALIAAAVTGQIDVRSHAPALSPEIAEAAAA